MRRPFKNQRLPKITVSQSDHERLSKLASAMLERIPDVAEELLSELDRARVVSDRSMRPNTARMGSTLEYRSDDGQQRQVTLVFPVEADIAQGKVSILTPIGAALIGLTEGQSITWSARDGRRRQLTVLSVKQPDRTADPIARPTTPRRLSRDRELAAEGDEVG